MESLDTLGLWGDGDEVTAIEEAFAVIGLNVPVEDAPNWVTVGDIWKSVVRVAPEMLGQSMAWEKFRVAISQDTAVNWELVGMETKVLDGLGHTFRQRLFKRIFERFRRVNNV